MLKANHQREQNACNRIREKNTGERRAIRENRIVQRRQHGGTEEDIRNSAKKMKQLR